MSNLKKTTLYALLVTSCFYWVSFNFLDKSIADAFHYMPHTGYLYPFCQVITLLGSAKTGFVFTLVSFVLAIFVLLKQPQNKLANHLLIMALAMVVAIFLETTLKYLLGRYRPEMLFQQGLYGFHYLSHQFLLNSTPSGHTTRFFVLVTGFSMMWKRLSPIFILLGLAVAFSRIVLEFHYLSDVVFGAMLGTFATLWIGRIYHSLTIASTATLLPTVK